MLWQNGDGAALTLVGVVRGSHSGGSVVGGIRRVKACMRDTVDEDALDVAVGADQSGTRDEQGGHQGLMRQHEIASSILNA